MNSYKLLYTQSLKHNKLHFAAHSHHPWPDCTLAAHNQYWLDSAQMLDDKWEYIFSNIISKLQKNIASTLSLGNPYQIAFAPNTHEFVTRLVSCLTKPVHQKIKILSTDAEFHSFKRQARRWEEAQLVEMEFVSVEPYETLQERWLQKIKKNDYDIIFSSYVFFNSGLRCPDLSSWVFEVPEKTMIVIDGYHSFFAIPKNLSAFQDRIFFMAGGYKYAQSGEGVCFLYAPENNLRPINTGWFASFETLNQTGQSNVEYSKSMRFAGSTFDPAGCYRMNAVYKMYEDSSLSVASVHERVQELKKYFLEKTSSFKTFQNLITENGDIPEAHFLTFRLENASEIQKLLSEHHIVVDSRGDRLRFGLGLYHDPVDVDKLFEKLKKILQ